MLADDKLAAEVHELIELLLRLRGEMLELTDMSAAELEKLHPTFRGSGNNLLHYLVLRQHDLRPLQARLAALGLSSLGRAECHTLDSVENVLRTLCALVGETPPEPTAGCLDYATGKALLTQHTSALLNHTPDHRDVRIMVTMPSEAADDYELVHRLLDKGMDCMRVNCAHDGPDEWSSMVEHLHRARKSLDKVCLVEMDLGGPKLRTGPLTPGPGVLRVRPLRDPLGHVIYPARIWLTPADDPAPAPAPGIYVAPVSGEWSNHLGSCDRLELTDARGARRRWQVLQVHERGALLESRKTTYLVPGIRLAFHGAPETKLELAELPSLEQPIVLRTGDELIVTRDQAPGCPAVFDEQGELLAPARIGCSLPEVFEDVSEGASILFDDGKIAGRVDSVGDEAVRVSITRTHPDGGKLRADKGINLPDSPLSLPAMTVQDVEDLAFAVKHADIIGLSFVNSADDVALLQRHLEALGDRQPAVVLKIETQRGFNNLPSILFAAMQLPRCGVMIARGDLAVEAGFVRLAEAQEEILWLCEAAHVPVIWATQVLENLAKEGMPSRAEITDAAMGDRAECVMLNKGPHILSAVGVLDDILSRMQAHQIKKQSMLRELQVAHRVSRSQAS